MDVLDELYGTVPVVAPNTVTKAEPSETVVKPEEKPSESIDWSFLTPGRVMTVGVSLVVLTIVGYAIYAFIAAKKEGAKTDATGA